MSDIQQRAAEFLMQRGEPGWSADQQMMLDAWLAESMSHKAAYWRLERSWQQADRLTALNLPEPRQSYFWPLPQALKAAAVVVPICAMILFSLILFRPSAEVERGLYATRLGQRTVVPLHDGSRLELNTKTAIRTALQEGRREIWLDRGEVYFEVAHRVDQPFTVHVGSRDVTVLGTKFAVRKDADGLILSVVEGRVRLERAGQAGGSAVLNRGEVAIAQGSSTLISYDELGVANNLGWRHGILVFDRKPLGEVAAEFNRYNRLQLVIEDPQTAAMKIGGSFRASDADAFVRLLEHAYQLKSEKTGDIVKISGS